ncbi:MULTISPECIES: hypothetical protein [unclassified Streptomyces]
MAERTRPGQIVRPECQIGEHAWCRLDEVRTPTAGILVFPAPRCDCACHKAVLA